MNVTNGHFPFIGIVLSIPRLESIIDFSFKAEIVIQSELSYRFLQKRREKTEDKRRCERVVKTFDSVLTFE